MVIDTESEPQPDSDTANPVYGFALDELIAKITAWAHKYSGKNGWVLNPDDEERAGLLKGLAANRLKYGKQYCPCRIRSGNPESDKKIICPCIYHRDEMATDGHCHCRLFFRKDATPEHEVVE